MNTESCFTEILVPSDPEFIENESNIEIEEQKNCAYCGFITNIPYETISESKTIINCCYSCYNVRNVGIKRNLFFVIKSNLSQVDLIKKSREWFIKKRIMPSVKEIDPEATKVNLTDFEFAATLRFIKKRKLKNTSFPEMKVYFNSRSIDYQSFTSSQHNVVVSTLKKKPVMNGIVKEYEFTKRELLIMKHVFYSNLLSEKKKKEKNISLIKEDGKFILNEYSYFEERMKNK